MFAQGKGQRPWKGAQGSGKERIQKHWKIAPLSFCRWALAKLLHLLTKCLAWCRSRNGSDAWCTFCSIVLSTEHISPFALENGIASQKAEHACTSQCFGVTNWDGRRGLLGLWHFVFSVPQAPFAHEKMG